MVKFGRFIAKHKYLILIISMLLLIPAVYGYANTRINYDVLSYLPKTLDTVAGQDIMVDEFGMGAFSMIVPHLVRAGAGSHGNRKAVLC